MSNNETSGVLVIYTGGTIGSVPKSDEPNSPLVPLTKDDVAKKGDNPLFRLIHRYNPKYSHIEFDGGTVMVDLKSLETPIDSSNVSPEVWSEITKIIEDNYRDYEGFVILNGTDTMTYTASVLSFMIGNLNKPIIVTGSQIPIGKTRSDAVQNLVTSIEIAAAKSLGKPVVPEVCLFFRNRLFRGNRTIKYSASNYEAFQSPNLPELGSADEYIVINEAITRSGSSQPLRIVKGYSPSVQYLKVAPGMNYKLIEAIAANEHIHGIILETYGTGNAPTRPDFLKAIGELLKVGKIIVNVTQCMSGEVELGLYDVSAGLLSRGVVSGLDMTSEAAYTKLCHLLGTEKADERYRIPDLMQINLRGEQKRSIFNLHFGKGEMSANDKTITVQPLRDMVDTKPATYNSTLIDRAFLRIMGISEMDGNNSQSARGKVYIDMDNATVKSPEDIDNYLGKFDKRWDPEDEGKENIFMTITEQARKYIDNSHPVSITIVNDNGRPFRWEKMEIGIFVNV